MVAKRQVRQSEGWLVSAVFARCFRAEPHENRDEAERIDRHKHRNEREQEFLDHLATDEHR